ncbi:MAG: DEAD/DEAH box helicase [Candidatus Bathyarchaeota archaeon]|nr:MAG: DEAD/DEAH box helicase [Candidatus Bathyarchaeota archaeon]
MNFDELEISPEVRRGLADLGFQEMFPIQEQALPRMLEGENVIGQAKTGTGKTAAFGVPMIEKLDWDAEGVQGLVLAPTRELALQISSDLSDYGRYTPLRVLTVYGGVSIERQIQELRRGVHVVVGTPGRIMDHMRRGTLSLGRIKAVVLDEADRMLDMGFVDDIEWILRRTPEVKQISLWSATIDDRTRRLYKRYMPDARMILVSRDEIALETIDQRYIKVAPYEKFDILTKLIDHMRIDRALLFCRRRTTVDRLTNQLKRARYDAEALHGQLSQARREAVLERFREARLSLLVATEVAARGLDIEDIPFIINFDIPDDPLMYFHRIGRTARAGKAGTAVTFVTYEEDYELARIEALTGTRINKMTLPPDFLL